MAVTWAVTNLKREVTGSKRVHRGTLTATGTYTAGGDAVSASALGLSTIEHLDLTTLNDAAGSPLTLVAVPVKVSESSWKVAVACNVVGAVNTATIAAGKTVALGAGETLTGYKTDFEAVGR
jgi:hypothetical protein